MLLHSLNPSRLCPPLSAGLLAGPHCYQQCTSALRRQAVITAAAVPLLDTAPITSSNGAHRTGARPAPGSQATTSGQLAASLLTSKILRASLSLAFVCSVHKPHMALTAAGAWPANLFNLRVRSRLQAVQPRLRGPPRRQTSKSC